MYLWEDNIDMPCFPRLEGDAETDVLIIGGGMTGILCAHKLQERGIDYLLVDASRIGSGTTRGTTAALTAQHGSVYTKLVKTFGKETARGYLKANLKAVAEYKALAETLDFDFEEKPSYTYSRSDRNGLMIEAVMVKELGFDAEYVKKPDLPFDTMGAVRFPGMAQFHPLKLIEALAGSMEIREHTKVKTVRKTAGYSGYEAHTEQGRIRAKKIIVASHYPFLGIKGMYPLKLYQKRSFVVALEKAAQLAGTYADEAEGGMYLRNYGELLIVGGGDYRTGTGNDGFHKVREFIKRTFPDAREQYAWAAQDCISLDEMPYIGRYSKGLPDVFVSTGFNEWGMSSAMTASAILTDMVTDRKNPYEKVFVTDRRMFRTQLAVNVGETLKNFFTPTVRRCSHMGCALKKNQDENTWDCPCHGSRFDEHGHVIDNPAKKNLNI